MTCHKKELIKQIVFCVCYTKAIAVINPVGPTITSEYSQCLITLLDDNLRTPGLLIVANTFNPTLTPVATIRTTILQEVHRKAKHSVQVVSPEETKHEREENKDESIHDLHFRHIEDFAIIPEGNYYVIVGGSFTQFKKVVFKLSTLRSWNPRALFIILLFIFPKDLDAVYYPEVILTHLFLLNVLNAVVLLPNPQDKRKLNVYGWKPIDPPKYCGYKNETAEGRLILENMCNRGNFQYKKYLFGDKIPHDMTGCKLNAITLMRRPFVNENEENYPGIERMLMDEIADAMNLKFIYTILNIPRGEKNITREWTGALAMIKADSADLLFGAIYPDNEVHEDYEASVSYFADSYTWVVPRASLSPAWKSLVIMFNKEVWVSAMGVYVICVITWKLLGKWSHESPYHGNIGHCSLNTWYTHVNGCAYSRPVGHSLRVFFIFLTLYCILFLTAYQTKLIDVLTNPTFNKQLDSPEGLVESDLKWGGLQELSDLFQNDDELDGIIADKYLSIEDSLAALTDVVYHRNFSLLYSRLALLDATARLHHLTDHHGLQTYYTFQSNVFSIPLEFITLEGFPLMDRFCFLISSFKQMGVMDKIKSISAFHTEWQRAMLVERATHKDDEKGGGQSLSMDHLQGGFLVLAIGHISGIVVLLIEVIVNSKWFLNLKQDFIEAIGKLSVNNKI